MSLELAVTAWWQSRGKKVVTREVETLINDPLVIDIYKQNKKLPSAFCEECGQRFGTHEEIAFVAFLLLHIEEELTHGPVVGEEVSGE